VRPPLTRAAIATASRKPIIKGHFTVVNGFMRFPWNSFSGGLEE
jgi:hypothetical protein